MGTYDEVRIGGSLYQTKALGKGMSLYNQGDKVQLVRVPITEHQHLIASLGEWDYTPQGNPSSYQFLAQGGQHKGYCYIIVTEGVISDMRYTPREDLPAYDYHGHLIQRHHHAPKS